MKKREKYFVKSFEEDFVCIHSISESVAKSFLEFFDGLWNISKN